jgi:hypothetical protein
MPRGDTKSEHFEPAGVRKYLGKMFFYPQVYAVYCLSIFFFVFVVACQYCPSVFPAVLLGNLIHNFELGQACLDLFRLGCNDDPSVIRR